MLPSGIFDTKYESDMAILRTKTQWSFLVAALVLLFTIPLFTSNYWVTWLTGIAITILAVLGLHILTGLCGIFSIGQAAFVGVGAYTTALLATRHGLSGWACLPIAGLAAGAVGLFFGLPSFRLKGFYIAIATLAASFIIIWSVRSPLGDWTGAGIGMGVAPLELGGIVLKTRVNCYYLAMGLVLLGTFFAKNIQRTSTGRAFVAIRDNELAAEVSGINLFRYKMLAFFIGCFYAGVAGWLLAYSNLWVTPDQFGLSNSIWYFGMLAIGGMGSTTGVFLGVLFLRLLQVLIDEITPLVPVAQFHVSMSMLLYSAVIMGFLILQPRGLHYLWEKVKVYYRLRPYSYRGG